MRPNNLRFRRNNSINNKINDCRLTTKPLAVTSTQKATTDTFSEKECAVKPDGFHRDPNNNQKYFQCVSGRTFHFTCPKNLVFNEISKVCDLSQTPNPKSTTSVRTVQPTSTSVRTTRISIDFAEQTN
jgi:hypothetical protein